MKSRRHRAVLKCNFYLSVSEDRKYWTNRFSNVSK